MAGRPNSQHLHKQMPSTWLRIHNYNLSIGLGNLWEITKSAKLKEPTLLTFSGLHQPSRKREDGEGQWIWALCPAGNKKPPGADLLAMPGTPWEKK